MLPDQTGSLVQFSNKSACLGWREMLFWRYGYNSQELRNVLAEKSGRV
jgi:hypothetical protein